MLHCSLRAHRENVKRIRISIISAIEFKMFFFLVDLRPCGSSVPTRGSIKKKRTKKRHSTRNVVSGFIGFGPGSDRVFPPGRRHESGRLFFDCFSFFICFPLEPVAVTGDGVGCGGGVTEFFYRVFFFLPNLPATAMNAADCVRRVLSFLYLFIYLFIKKKG